LQPDPIGSAKLNDRDPEACLRFVIERIAEYRINGLGDLLPSVSPSSLPGPSITPQPPDSH